MTISTKFAAAAAFLICLSGCNRQAETEAAATPDPVIAVPVEYTAAEKAAIQATFPAPYNTADLAAGEKQFNKCRACHTIAPESMNMTGPHLYGVFGRKAATAKGYTYSDAMVAHDVVWDYATLDTYLAAPQQVVKGTKMGFMGMPNEQDRHNLIAYLKLETSPHEKSSSSEAASK